MFFIYDYIILRQSSAGNAIQAKQGYYENIDQDISNITRKDLELAKKEFEAHKPTSHPIIKKLIFNMRMVSRHNPESWGEKLQIRNILFANIIRYGLPAIWFTINPADLHNPLVLSIAGINFSEHHAFSDLKRRIRIEAIKDPAVMAEFFNLSVNAFFQSLIQSGQDRLGIFGKVVAHFGVVESNKRMMLHLHGFIWLEGNEGIHLMSERLLTDISYQERVLKYVSSIICQEVDMKEGDRFKPTLALDWTFNAAEHSIPSEFWAALRYDGNRVAVKHQRHEHKEGCLSYGNSYKSKIKVTKEKQGTVLTPQDSVLVAQAAKTGVPVNAGVLSKAGRLLYDLCRYLFPRVLVAETRVNEHGGIDIKRNHPWINSFNRSIVYLF